MKLIGRFLSPYVRRVAVSMNALGIAFESEPVLVFEKPEAVRAHNPLVRVPTLVMADGEALVESWAILDAIDEMVPADRRLMPSSGPSRRQAMKLTAIGVGSMEKAQWAFYETRFHPAEKVHEPWIEHNDGQVLGGLGYLDGLAAKAGGGWLAGTPAMTQADITAAVAYGFVKAVRPKLGIEGHVPNLAAFAARCEALQAFKAAPLPA